MKTLDAAARDKLLARHPRWSLATHAILQLFEFKDFAAAMHFVNQVADLAERENHHPDIDIRWNKVTLTLTSHSAGGLTEADFQLAGGIDPLAGKRS